MKSHELKKWLEEHYGRGQRLAFVTDYNAATEAFGDEPITLDALENWLYRQPPQGRRFEQTLELVLAWREEVKPIVNVYTVNIPLTAERQQLIKEMAGDGKNAPELFLRFIVYQALEREIEEYLEGIRNSLKRPRGRPAKPIVITPPEMETQPLNNKPEPKPRRVNVKIPKNGRHR